MRPELWENLSEEARDNFVLPMVETTFTYKIPDEWRGDTFNQNKTGTFTYKGPRYLIFEVEKATGKENGWCLTTPRELERPCALDSVRITVDCSLEENGLLCEIANDVGSQEQVEFKSKRKWIPMYEPVDGYSVLEQPTEFEPRDFYDEFNITYDFETGEWNVPLHTMATDVDIEMTWDDVKETRNRYLRDTDGKISDDMPENLKQQWREYRQLLRDMPDKLSHLPPYIAVQMFPPHPEG